MSAREIEPRTGFSPSTSNPSPHLQPGPSTSAPDSNVAIIDIGSFVANYTIMAEFLYPLELMSSSILYIVRWENYLLTFSTLVLLCILFYHPALLAGCVVGLSIVGMATGKYYSQSKLNTLKRRRETQEVQYLNEDSQALTQCKKDQKASHKLLLEYRRIICVGESVITRVTKALEYTYKIILWESLEISLCVTVLLCVLFILLCTVYLRILSASFPLIILCFNRHFIKKTVELWKSLLSFVYSKVRLKRREVKALVPGGGSAEVVHHYAQSAPLNHIRAAVSVGVAACSDGNPDSQAIHTGSGGSSSQEGQTAAAARNSHATNGSEGADKEGGNLVHSNKGFCTKCNTSLAKLLKRKHDCNFCGQSYCGSCTVKVKRALLGATSPAAFEESVRVCLDCKHQLDDLKLA